MKSSILDSISSPEDLKNLSFEELGPLCTRNSADIDPDHSKKWRTSGVESGNSGTDGCTSPCF